MRYDNFIPPPRKVQIHSRGRLPHWQVDAAVYFITFRTRDALPRELAAELMRERDRALRDCRSAADRVKLDHAFALRLDLELDAGYGSCLVGQHAATVAAALQHFHRVRYELHAWCVMPNHVHVMLYLERGGDLPKIVHSWKSYTAHQMGKGVIWQREYFDRVIRSPAEFIETAAYIRNNPAKAGLKNWPWVG